MAKNKHKKLFTIKSDQNKINMINSLSPMQLKAVQDLMKLKILQEMYD